MSKAFTLIEMLIVIGMLTLLIGVAMYVFHVILMTWVSEEGRIAIALRTDRAMNMMVKDVREASSIGQAHQHEIRLTAKRRQADGTPIPNTYDHFIYYFHNSADVYPSNFNQSLYDLRKATLNGVTGSDLSTGTFTYGSGQFVADGMLSPHTALPAHPSDLVINGGVATLDLSIKNGDETIRTRTEATPRNL